MNKREDFIFASGVELPFPEQIKEGYKQISKDKIILNLSLNKFEKLITNFINNNLEPFFIVIECPLNQKEEDKLRKTDIDPFHCEATYFGLFTKDQIRAIINKHQELLFNDGMSKFAIQSLETKDEIYFVYYKTIYIYSTRINEYIDNLKNYDIHEDNNLKTAIQTVSYENPGARYVIKKNDKTIRDVIKELKDQYEYYIKVIEDK